MRTLRTLGGRSRQSGRLLSLPPKLALPLGILLVGAAGGGLMVSVHPSVETRPAERATPLVEVVIAEPRSVRLDVEAQGTVVPRTESDLVAEVSGRITWVSPSLAAGGFLDPGEPLARIDASDYEVAVERAEATLARSESELELALAQRERRRQLAEHGVASPVELDDAMNGARVAQASVREAKAALLQARRDLARTEIVAPFAGRVREKRVDVGQFVTRGSPVARFYAVDYAEVRLPIADGDAAFVDLPIDYRDTESEARRPGVELHARFAGHSYTWSGHIVRTEGELDPQTRMIHAVARVEDPYGRGPEPGRAPLAVGLFVDAVIEGREVDDIVSLPRSALRGSGEVAIVDANGRLRLRPVQVIRRVRDSVLIESGLVPGERVIVSPLALAVDGMQVRVAEDRGVRAPRSPAVARSGS